MLDDKLGSADGQIKRQRDLVAQARPDEKQTAELNEQIEAAQAEAEAAKERSSGTEHEVKKLNAKIKEVTGGKLKELSKKLEKTRSQLEDVKAHITKLEVSESVVTINE